MSSAILSEEERNRIRYHTGYLITQGAASISIGFPSLSQTAFLLETALNLIPNDAVGLVREKVAVLDGLEKRMVDAQKRLSVEKLGEMSLRKDEIVALRGEYKYWAASLAELLGVPLNAYSRRFGGSRGINVPVT